MFVARAAISSAVVAGVVFLAHRLSTGLRPDGANDDASEENDKRKPHTDQLPEHSRAGGEAQENATSGENVPDTTIGVLVKSPASDMGAEPWLRRGSGDGRGVSISCVPGPGGRSNGMAALAWHNAGGTGADIFALCCGAGASSKAPPARAFEFFPKALLYHWVASVGPAPEHCKLAEWQRVFALALTHLREDTRMTAGYGDEWGSFGMAAVFLDPGGDLVVARTGPCVCLLGSLSSQGVTSVHRIAPTEADVILPMSVIKPAVGLIEGARWGRHVLVLAPEAVCSAVGDMQVIMLASSRVMPGLTPSESVVWAAQRSFGNHVQAAHGLSVMVVQLGLLEEVL